MFLVEITYLRERVLVRNFNILQRVWLNRVTLKVIFFQAIGVVPTISIDKTDGTQIYLNEKSLDTQIITAKSSEINVCITKSNGDLVSKIKKC